MKSQPMSINLKAVAFALMGLMYSLPATATVMGSVGYVTVCSERFESTELRMNSLLQAINGRFAGTNLAIIQLSIQHNGLQQCANIWYQVR